ncbi:MAG: hybrid sensor histidine kinase/response regulator [Gammaproteobacteria bacterium]|nr:MAG: hybrid sensor histidine kinase/response regulator [Gammaproteobacteria bacterium]
MLFNSRLFRRAFFAIQITVVLFTGTLFYLVVPYIEQHLYENEERLAASLMSRVIGGVERESRAIDQYWEDKERDNLAILRDMASIKLSAIANNIDLYKKGVLTEEVMVSLIRQIISGAGASLTERDEVHSWIASRYGEVLFWSKNKPPEADLRKVTDYYGNYYFKDIKATLTNGAGYYKYWQKSVNGTGEVPVWGYCISIGFRDWIMAVETEVAEESAVEVRDSKILGRVKSEIQNLPYFKAGFFVVLNRKGEQVYSSVRGGKNKLLIPEAGSISEMAIRILDDGNKNKREIVKHDIDGKVIWYKYVKGYNLGFFLIISREELYKPAEEVKSRIVITVLLLVMFLSLIITWYIRSLVHHIRHLAEIAASVGKGELSSRVKIKRNDEIGFLAGSVNQMIANIEKRTEELDRLNGQYLLARDEAEQANGIKSKFLTAVSHDLIQPLSAAKIVLEVINRKNNNSSQAEILKAINSLATAERMIEELVDIARIESGNVIVKNEALYLDEIFDSIKTEFKIIAAKKGVELRIRYCGIVLESDRKILRHIIRNLVSNAINYTSVGGILLGARKVEGKYRIIVADTGPGIEESMQRQIFKEFSRGDAKGSGNHFGLGLSIVDKMSQLLGAEVVLKSQYGRGSTFSVTINRYSQKIESISGDECEKRVDLHKNKILCVDDDLEILAAMEMLISSCNGKPLLAANMDDINEILDSLQGGGEGEICLVISDYHLTDNLTGVEVIKYVWRQLGEKVPGVIVSGMLDQELTERLQVESIVGYIKPLDERCLLEIIKDHLI